MSANLEQKQITKEINKALNSGFKINTESDEDFLKNSNYSWDDLNNLKEDLGKNILEFVFRVNEIIQNKDIVNNLNDKKEHFDKLISLFFSDINNFSLSVKNLRKQHEHLSGHINNINDFNVYNRIAIQYQSLFSELATLITPTLSDLMLTITDVASEQKSSLTNIVSEQKNSLISEQENSLIIEQGNTNAN